MFFLQFKMKSGMHYGEEKCPVPTPDNFPKDDELHFEIQLIEFGKAKANYARPISLLFLVLGT